jgi:hypothetical protein
LASNDDQGKKGEVLDALPFDEASGGIDVLALISNYTERPDLLLEVVEKHDPGFIKRMNENAESGAQEFKRARFNFGRNQAYISLLVQVLVALALVGLAFVALLTKQLTFWLLIAIAIFYAIAQGGRHGFMEVISGLKEMLTRGGSSGPKE